MMGSGLKRIKYYALTQLGKRFPKLDPEYTKALAIAAWSGDFRISTLQRNLRLGYSRACRLMTEIKKEIPVAMIRRKIEVPRLDRR